MLSFTTWLVLFRQSHDSWQLSWQPRNLPVLSGTIPTMEPLKCIISNKKTGYELHIFDCVDVLSVLPVALEKTVGKFCSLVAHKKDAAEVKS